MEQNTIQNYLGDSYATNYPETYPFWEAAEQGQLLLKTCSDCERAHWYPRIICPLCGSGNTLWKQASGKGTLYTFSVIARAEPPYALAYVQLQEGPIVMTNLVDCDFDKLQIGDPVQVKFRATKEGRSMPVFAPAAG
ncbi:Zn-ribbon domain-containing OB-fold protein [Alcaligenaceae bacterium]|nr:Zn-ribbon domain-containing OB-fold protein [Alcaligenaceae bacterium]